MLTGIANFLFGREASPQRNGGGCLEYDTREEDEWIVVDVSEPNAKNEKQEDKRSCISLPPTDFLPVLKESPSPTHTGNSISPPRPSSVSPSQMEGSWYVTPPPCFTAGGPVHVEMSPLENLLIEHPSMSVYGSTPLSSLHSNSQKPNPASSCISLPAKKEQSASGHLPLSSPPQPQSSLLVSSSTASQLPSLPQPAIEQRKHRVRNAQVIHNRNSHHAVDISGKAGLLEQIENLIPAQRAQQRQDQRKLRSTQMDRQNRVRLYQSSSRNLRRKDRWLHHSGVNNNRKC